MMSRLTLAGSLLLLSGALGQTLAGPTISDKRYWPNEGGRAAHTSSSRSVDAPQIADGARAQVSVPPARVHTYQGGPKNGSWSFR